MVLKLQPYDFKVEYLPAHLMTADILSRTPITESDNATCNLTEKYINYAITASLPVAVTLDELKHVSESDPVMSKIRSCIESNKWIKRDPLKPYYQISYSNNYVFQNWGRHIVFSAVLSLSIHLSVCRSVRHKSCLHNKYETL